MYKVLSQLGRALMLPIAVLPAAGLLLGIGSAFTSDMAVKAFPILDNEIVFSILTILKGAGSVVFENIALLFSIGIAVGLAKENKGTAGLSGGLAFMIFATVMLDCQELQVFDEFAKGVKMDTGVLGAIVIGVTVSILHNKFHKTQLPDALAFFSGNRLIPILSAIAAILLGVIFFFLWPVLYKALIVGSEWIAKLGCIGSFLYGASMRLLGAVGLHHAVYPMFWFTELGGVEDVAGQTIAGAQNIYFAQMADAGHEGLYTYGTRFFAGRFPTIMFGVPAAALAMYFAIPKKNRKKFKGLYFSGGLTAFLTGVTEPIEYSFLFVAPWLYAIHCILDGVSFLVMDILSVRIGNAFGAGIFEFGLFGIMQGNEKSNWIICVLIGLVWAVGYFIIFYALIKKFRIPIPGMVTKDAASEEFVPKTKEDKLALQAAHIFKALGGSSNIETLSACATRLRVSVKDVSLVDKDALKTEGALAIIEKGGGIQAVYGPKADLISTEINSIIKNEETEQENDKSYSKNEYIEITESKGKDRGKNE